VTDKRGKNIRFSHWWLRPRYYSVKSTFA